MAFTLVTTQTILARNAGALYNLELGSTTMSSLVAQTAAAGGIDAFLNAVYNSSVGATATTVVAAELVKNLGFTDATLKAQAEAIIVANLNAVPSTARGAVINNILSTFSTLTADATWGAAATAFNTQVANAEAYAAVSTNTSNAAFDTASSTTAGSTFTLTSSVQSLTGSAGDDTFIAGDEGGKATLNAGDTISSGSGTDTLKIFNAAGAINTANFSSAVISGVENVEATMSATAQTLDVSANADVTKVTLVNGFDGVVTLKAAQTAGLKGGISTVGAAATFAFSDVTGGADSVNLTLDSADLVTTSGALDLTIAGVETLNIAATGTNKLGTTTLAATTKLVITGAGSVSTTLASTLAKTIDGSAATGDLTIDNSAAAAATQDIKTGTGNDTYTTTYAALAADDAIDLGTGTDSLRFSDAAIFNSTATKAFLTKVTGVEQLGTVSALLTVDGDFVSQTSYYTDGAAGDFALTNIANNADINYGAGVILANAVGMKLGANTLNVNLAGSKAAAADVTTGLTVTGSANINVNSTGTDGVANNVLVVTAADNQNVVVTGSQNLTLTTNAAVATTGFSIDASAFTGKLTVTGTAASDIVKGGTANDTISGGAGAAIADTLTGNGGADKFTIVAGATATTVDTITDFVTKSDTIDFTGIIAGSSTNYSEATAAVADFTAALAAANTALDGTVLYNAQQVGSDVYVFADAAGTGSAVEAVKLTGVALAGIEFGDIVA
jgi:hypothetical protein